ncbi:MAG: hypothetical protein CMJ18_18290 [Phycisphaeraceae bacterium]|nr:hypothetical protein [Phycisphaeraceae bacterium]
MNIVHYQHVMNLSAGGTTRTTTDVGTILNERGHEVTVITYDDTDVPDSWRQGDPGQPRVVRIDPPRPPLGRFARSTMKQVEPLVAEADVLHLHAPWDPPNPQFAAVARRTGTPYVLSLHGMLDEYSMRQRGLKKKLYMALVGRKLLERAACVHCDNETEAEQSHPWFPRGRTMVIPVILDLDLFEELPGPELARLSFDDLPDASEADADAVVLFLSRVQEKKGIEVLIDATERLRDRDVRCRVIVAGDAEVPGYDAQLMADIARRGLDDRIRFVGLVGGPKKLSLYEAADVFALPTRQESFGIVFAESLACRTPVITTRGVHIWPQLEESGGALIVERTADAFADAIVTLLEAGPPRRREMGEMGRAWVFEYLGMDRVAGLYETLYRNAVGHRT